MLGFQYLIHAKLRISSQLNKMLSQVVIISCYFYPHSRCSHGRLVKLLQSSGSCPRLGVGYAAATATPTTRPLAASRPVSPLLADSHSDSHSSHVSEAEWPPDGRPVIQAQDQSFKEKVDYILTVKERTALRKALVDYNIDR